VALPARDYQRIIDLAVGVLDTHATQTAWDLVTGEIVTALSGEVGWMYENINFERNTGRPCAWSPAVAGGQPLESLLQAHMPRHPLALHLAATGDPTPVTVHDVISDRAWRSNPARSSLKTTFGVTRQIALAVPYTAGRRTSSQTWRSCLIGRSGRDFTVANREFAARLQPLLARLDRHLGELDRLRGLLSAAGRASPEREAAAVGLTPRELTVLALLAEGLTAAALARRLGISTRTAVKHLENIYRKCGTSDRLSTVLLAQELGLVPSRLSQPRPRRPRARAAT
jgi:DNA-binding CsgD family transcriptional regulator